MTDTDDTQAVETSTPIEQIEHLLGLILGQVHGTQVVAEVTAIRDGVPQRYEVVATRFDDPQRRLGLTLREAPTTATR